jgi:Ca2+-binding EF-hand superfamily protein
MSKYDLHSLNDLQLNEFKEAFWLLDRESTGKITIESIVNHFSQIGKMFDRNEIKETLSASSSDGESLDLTEV